MTEFDRIIDKHFLEFDKYTHKVCISRDELAMICREYAIEMCQIQIENCTNNLVFGDTEYLNIEKQVLYAPFPEELQ